MRNKLLNSFLVILIGCAVGISTAYAINKKFVTTASNVAWRYYWMENDVDGKSLASTTIVNTGDGEFHLMGIHVETTNASGVLTPALISVGTNSPNYDNLVALGTVGTLTDRNLFLSISSNNIRVPANTDIKVRVVTAAIGTSQNFRIAMHGHTGAQ